CWTYWVVSAGAHPGLLLNIENERPIEFRRDKYGRYEMWTYDGAFDYFDELSHAETVFPRVILGLEGRDLVNLNVKHRSAYDKEIRDARKNLTPSKIAALRSAKNPYYDQLETSITVLTIVLAQLYGGREREGWKTLEQMWPSHDVARLTALIKKTRAEGVLAYLPPRSRAALEPVLSRRIPVATAR
ncbi:MAG TPA: hypothetical protein VGQ11_06650, partial [Candidatus Acidoferrales bacterium]|nr:hypothetical protein [Candidatus Acidoferrales bacterium]